MGKKITSVAIAVFFIGFSSAHCGEEMYEQQDSVVAGNRSVPLYSKYGLNNFLFDFMRKNQFLADWELSFGNVEEQTTFSTLPFSNLYLKLEGKLSALAQAEEDFATSNEDARILELKNIISNIPLARTEAELHQNLAVIFEFQSKKFDCQNTLDRQSLRIAFDYDLNQIRSLLDGFNESEQKDLLSKIHKYSLSKHKALIANNEPILKQIEQIANQGFIIKDQLCKNYENQEFCVEKEEEKAIKTLSDLVEYSTKCEEFEAEVFELFSNFQKEYFCAESFTLNNDELNKNFIKKNKRLKKVFNELKNGFKEAYSEVKPVVQEAYSEVKPVIKKAVSKVKNKIKNAFKGIKKKKIMS